MGVRRRQLPAITNNPVQKIWVIAELRSLTKEEEKKDVDQSYRWIPARDICL
jgi:hypothetical protein